ncbi:MAG: Crp/Fnr family transcriptional regulator [Sphingomonadales bacterium]
MKCESCPVRKHGFCQFVNHSQLSEYDALRIGPKTAPTKALLDWSRSGKHIHIIRQGWATQFGTVPDGRAKITDILAPGDIAPLSRVFSADSNLNLRAISNVEYCSFHVDELQQFLQRHPQALKAFFDKIGAMLKRCETMTVALGALSAKEGMLCVLLALYRKLTKALEQEELTYTTLPLKTKMLGELVGITSVHAGRLVAEFEEQGLMRRTPDGLVINFLALTESAMRYAPDLA